ncbi:MAG: GAF domain-containing protein [Anaerolineae bacterium]|nr:GAF domain-containing protein [Anaerolineae bacterium]
MDTVKTSQSEMLRTKFLAETQVSPDQTGNGQKDELTRLTREAKELRILYNLALAIGSTLELNRVIWRLYKEGSRIIDTSNFAVALYQADTKILNFKLVVRQGQPVKPFSINLSQNHTPGVAIRTLIRQSPLLIQNINVDDIVEIEQNYPGQKIRSWLSVPLPNPAGVNRNPQGIVAIWSDRPHAFGNHEVWLLSALGSQAAIAIHNAQLFEVGQRQLKKATLLSEVSQRRAAEVTRLNNIARTLSSTLQFDEVLTRVREGVDDILNVEAGFLFLVDALTGDLVFQIGWGKRFEHRKPFRIPKELDLAGEVATTGKQLMLTEAELSQIQVNGLGPKFGLTVRNLLCVPLISHGQIIGVLEIFNKKERDFTSNDLELLSSIASYAAIAIENARLHQKILAKRDEVIETEDQARRDLARDLHDGPTQLISSILMRLDFCKMLLEREPAKLAEELANTQKLAEQAIHEIRTLLFEMRPLILEAQGLGEALKIFMERRQQDVEGKTRLTLEIKTPNPDGEISRQDAKTEAAIFAIVQETVNNALKHADAQNITVQLKETASAIYVIITDDGTGFDINQTLSNYQQRESFGIVNIRERTQLMGAELTMKSVPGNGTQITVYLPKAREERLRKRGTGPLSMPLDMPQNGG